MSRITKFKNKFFADKRIESSGTDPKVFQEYLDELNKIILEDNENIEALDMKNYILLYKIPESIDILNDKTDNFASLHKYEECIHTCQHMLEIDPKNEDAIYHWEIAYLKAQDNTLPKPPKTLKEKLSDTIYLTFRIIKTILC